MRQLLADFVRNHSSNLAIFGTAALRGIGYIPIHDPLCRNHVAEIRHIHFGDVSKLNVGKSGDVPRLMAAQVTADLAHGFHRFRVDFVARLDARLQTSTPRLADIFNSASAIGLRLAFLTQTNRIFNGSRLPLSQRAPRIRPVLLRVPIDLRTPG